jgi:hypothetical protein
MIGRIEVINEDGVHREPLLHFAGDIVGSAIFRRIPGDPDTKFGELIDSVFAGYQHAIDCVQILVAVYLWPRFGR